MRDGLNISSLPSPQDRYKLEKKLGAGIFGEVYRAQDTQANGKAVAIKIQINTEENETHIQDEYKILRDFTQHPNIVDFYGVFCERIDYEKRIWFVLELCEYGSVIDIVRKLKAMDRKMSEEHIAYILKYTIKIIDGWARQMLYDKSTYPDQKAVVYLHENNILHRNIRCSNILISKEGEIKLTDFSLSCKLNGPDDRAKLSIGSPSWMAPEMITSGEEGYGNRSDVWAIGISTIEMVDGKGPFEDMHPTGALFQIQRNPPPSVLKPSMSSNDLNDFVSECLSKNPEYRPFMMELEEHPFIQTVPENDFHLSTELKMLAADLINKEAPPKIPEKIIKNGLLTTQGGKEHETMQVEDLAALEHLTEDSILFELQVKFQKGAFTSFIGDVLLILNPNADVDIYHDEYHRKYECKSRSDNEPHIFAVADAAYQDALHHNEPQHIVFSGECKSGKTTSMNHALSHLSYLGSMKNNTGERIKKAAKVIQDCITAATPINSDSTRGIFQIQVTYGTSGKLSGALYWLYQLEKWRVSSTDMSHANFNIMYYFYDGLEAEGRLNEFHLESNRKHRYLRILEEPGKFAKGVREAPVQNVRQYKEFRENLKFLEWEEEEIKFFEKVLASILILGNVRFRDGKNGSAEIENLDDAKKVAKLLELEEVKFLWALLNYCLIENGNAVKRRHSTDEARDARDTLASALYKRLIDWMVNLINSKLAFMRAVFGDKYSVSLLDMFGFECYHRNRLEQLIVNTTNEQIQFLYNQRMFAWEMQEEAEEGVRAAALHFYDNKKSVDQLMKKPLGVFYILDDASRVGEGAEYIMNTLKSKCKGPYVKTCGTHEFSVAHYTGKVNYDVREMADKNKDFLPPEMIETMRSSSNLILQELFRNKFTKAGNLTASTDASPAQPGRSKSEKELDNLKARKHNVETKGQYSQIRRMRTVSAVYRATSLEILKQLSIGPGSGGTFYVRCIRTDLNDSPRGFQTEVVKQQLRALAVLDTAKARQFGFSCRVPFAEFIRRYRFLAFDFDETVEETADNCRLLLIRLKMEGWELGKTKVFLKYYNEEFLSRLYETQVKKIIKVQSMMRLFLAKRKATKDKSKRMHIKELKKQQSQQRPDCSEEEAALRIQKAYRGFVVRKAYGPLVNKSTGQIDETTAKFLKSFARKWKSRSMFQVLLQYRAVRYQDLVNFSQQVHIYNQGVVDSILNTSIPISLDRVDPQAKESTFLGNAPQSVWKLPFRIDQIQYYDTSHMCDPSMRKSDTLASPSDYDNEPQWDEPLRRRCTSVQTDPFATSTSTQTLITIPFCRDPSLTIPTLPPDDEEIDPGPPTDLPEESEVDPDSVPQDPPQDSATVIPDETKIDPDPVATETSVEPETEPESVPVDPPTEPDSEPSPADPPTEPEPEPVTEVPPPESEPDAEVPPPEPEQVAEVPAPEPDKDLKATPDPETEPTSDPDPETGAPSDNPDNDPQDTVASPTDSDNEPWDEPLRRRCNSAQTDPFKASISTQTLITIPFCRDPTLPVPTLPPDEPEIYPRSKSPNKIMYPRNSGRSPSPQAYYQPPAPWNDDTNVLENTAQPIRRPTRVQYNVDTSDLPDPISELHALAKLSHTNENEDDPPFNFQAMLKRTPRNRASMKRHGEIRGSGDESRSSGDSRSVYYGGNGNSTRNQESQFGGRGDYEYGDNSRGQFSGRDNRDDRETIEIAPGITIEGEVADL